MEGIVCTLPAKPSSKKNDVRFKISPTIVEIIGKGLDYKTGLMVNLLNTYKDKTQDFETYLKELKDEDYLYDYIYTDKDYLKEITELIYQMIDNKIITETHANVLRCECGKVDLLQRAITSGVDGTLYEFKKNKMLCKHCHSECVETTENILKVDVEKTKIDQMSVVPKYFNNVINGIIQEMSGSFIQISKKRETGCTVDYNGRQYNIDIDFIWTLLVLIIKSNQKILVAGNRQILKMFVINYINSLTKKDDLIFVAHPFIYLDGYEENKSTELQDNILLQKLEILFNLKWKNNNCTFNDSVRKYIKKLSTEDKLKLFQIIINNFKQNNNLSLEELLQKSLNEASNLQKNIKILKKSKNLKELIIKT